ncbi:MAG TPA: DEAD/DEAH box helicase, partial [Candidatus Dormibacteraeota bacterium]|nr:DEAD/DEAH box helicase [Candidatus Dormibacteraeota bacterium]
MAGTGSGEGRVREGTVAQGLDLDRPLEVGERVRFRSLQWEVEDAGERLVTLFGREAVNRGRRVRVVQGLEPIERTAPPPLVCRIGDKGWDHADWQGLHDAFRLTLAHGRGSLGTAAWGRMVLEPYQLVPLQRIEQLPEPRLLIADDVGLGKTSEAGLILSRLLQRRRADRILVLSRARPEPERWRDELQEKFGLEFEVIADGADYARLRRRVPAHLNLYAALPRLVVSMYFAAQSERVVELERPGLRWDVVVVDEAHHVADRGSGEKRLTHLGRVVAERCDALLLLTATPHDGKVRSFASLIELVDPYAVADREQLQPRLV